LHEAIATLTSEAAKLTTTSFRDRDILVLLAKVGEQLALAGLKPLASPCHMRSSGQATAIIAQIRRVVVTLPPCSAKGAKYSPPDVRRIRFAKKREKTAHNFVGIRDIPVYSEEKGRGLYPAPRFLK
jgi:hypothetical protein